MAVESLPPGLEATYSRCLTRKRADLRCLAGKRADRLLCDVDLLIWVCATPEPLRIDALQEILAMDMETGMISPDRMRTEEYLL
jgi:hypothetical protein